MSQLFDIEENVSETEENVEEEPNYDASTSNENETLSVDAPVVSADMITFKSKSYYGPTPRLKNMVDLVLLMS